MSFNISISDIEIQVLNFLDDLDISPVDRHLVIDGDLHRYRTLDDKPGKMSGAYCIFPDGLPAGFVQDWRTGVKQNWKFNTDGLPNEQREYLNSPEVRDKAEKIRKQREKEEQKKAIKAAEHSRILWENLPPADESHPYLQTKNVPCYGLHINSENKLAIPLRDINGIVKSLQWIDKNGDKSFQPHAKTKGLFWSIALDLINQQSDLPILIGEGYATMAKIHELTDFPCVAAMNCGALEYVSSIVKKAFPNQKIIIMADDDKQTQLKNGYNPGIELANNACKKLALQGVFPPPFKSPDDGTDWDDFSLKYGDDVTAKILKNTIPQFLLTDTEKKQNEKRNKILSLVNDLDPNAKVEPLELIGAMYPRKFISAIVAPSGTGKTMFMQKNVSDLSIGGNIFDGFAEDEPPRKSLIFAGEAGYELLIRRGASTKWAINPKNVKVVDQYKFESNNITVALDSPEGWENIKMLVALYKPDIVFFDTFSSFHDKDENKATDMKPLIKKLADLARDENIAVVLVHHSRKRTAKERSLSLNQDDVIGSSVFNRLVGLIIGIEPMKEDEHTLLVRTLKTWFSTFMPFTYKISESSDGRTVIETDLAPASVNNSKIAVWNYLQKNFVPGEWFSFGHIIAEEIDGNVTLRQVRTILADFVKNKKLKKRGEKRYTEYCLSGFYDKNE